MGGGGGGGGWATAPVLLPACPDSGGSCGSELLTCPAHMAGSGGEGGGSGCSATICLGGGGAIGS